jgi:predicted transcriptional regulator
MSDMATLNLRLPDSLDRQLTALAAQTHQNRSDLARAALEKYLRDLESERLLAGMVEAARFLASNHEARAESMQKAARPVTLSLKSGGNNAARGNLAGATQSQCRR